MQNPTGQTFENWLKRPVYVAQCHTWALAVKMRVQSSRFRCLPAYRDSQAMQNRKRVADAVRSQRSLSLRTKIVQAKMKVSGKPDPVTGFMVSVQDNLDQLMQYHRLQREQVELTNDISTAHASPNSGTKFCIKNAYVDEFWTVEGNVTQIFSTFQEAEDEANRYRESMNLDAHESMVVPVQV